MTKATVAQHGSAAMYNKGCRCLACKSAHGERHRNRRLLGNTKAKTVAKATGRKTLGDIEKAVIEEAAMMARPPSQVDVLAARNLAAILDEPLMVARHARVTAQLVATLKMMHGDDKRKAQRRNSRRLAAVQKITTTNRRASK